MAEQILKVFVVDDDPVARAINTRNLHGLEVAIAEFADGDTCLAAAGNAPVIVLLDVEMPGIDGVAVCRRLRASGRTDAEIIFVTCHDDFETRLAAHDAGGNHYIVKPYAKEELCRKVEAAKRAIRARCEVAEHIALARQSVGTDMPAPGDTDMLITFLRDASLCRTVDDLGLTLCKALQQYGVCGVVVFHNAQGSRCYSSRGRLTALEASLVDHARGIDGLFQFHDRLTIQLPHTTLLIPNLSPADHERASGLQHHMTVLVGSAEIRFNAMLNDGRRLDPAKDIIDMFDEFSRALGEDIGGAHGDGDALGVREGTTEIFSLAADVCAK